MYMIETVCAAVIVLAIYFIFENVGALQSFAQYWLYAFWALLAVVVIVAIVVAIITIVRTVKKDDKKDERKRNAQAKE